MSNTLLSSTEGLAILAIFGVVMFVLVWFKTKGGHTSEGFLVANRNVPLLNGAFSIAVSWIWAPAVFICSLQAYTQGLAGIFWFTVPNILCFMTFAPLGIRLRRLMPQGYTLPEFIDKRYNGNKIAHLAFLAVFFGYQLGAIIINAVAGGNLINMVSGVDIHTAIICMSLIAFAYSMLSGLEASVFTDVIQMVMVLTIAFVLVPWTIVEAGGFQVVTAGFGGVSGEYGNIFHPGVAFAMGIPMTLGLIAGPIGDQMFFQRAMAVKKKNIAKTFVLGGLIFGAVPIVLSLLGFIGASPEVSSQITVEDPQVVGAVVIGHFLPKAALIMFCFMAFAGLASTLDSAYCAISSLGSMDIYKKYLNTHPNNDQLLRAARITMAIMALLGTGIALLQPKLLWVFLIYGALASAGMFPTILSLFWKRLPARGAALAVVLSLVIGIPLSIHGNVTGNPTMVVIGALVSVGIGLVTSLIMGWANKGPDFEFNNLETSPSE